VVFEKYSVDDCNCKVFCIVGLMTFDKNIFWYLVFCILYHQQT